MAIADLLEELGGKTATEQIAQRSLDRSLSALKSLDLPPLVRADLAELLQFTVTRRPRVHVSSPTRGLTTGKPIRPS